MLEKPFTSLLFKTVDVDGIAVSEIFTEGIHGIKRKCASNAHHVLI